MTLFGMAKCYAGLVIRIGLLVALSIGSIVASSAGTAADKIHAAYVLFADSPKDGTVLLARVILDAASACPALQHSGKTITMSVRRNPNPRTFPVTVCEARYPFGAALTVAGSTLRLPRVTREGHRMVVLGDTGCRGLNKEGRGQNCDDPAAWPIWAVVARAHGTGQVATRTPGAFIEPNKTLQRALRLGSGSSLPAAIGLVVAGHLHRFQSLTFASDRPPTVVVGDSGYEPDRSDLAGTFVASVDGAKANVLSEDIFGYLEMRLGRKGAWEGDVVHRRPGDDKRVIADCGTSRLAKGSLCVLRPK